MDITYIAEVGLVQNEVGERAIVRGRRQELHISAKIVLMNG